MKNIDSRKSPQKQLDSFIARYDAAIAKHARAVLAKLRKFLPPSIEMVYDNYNALVVGFGPTQRPSEAVFSVVIYPRYVSLCFLQGARLPDPKKRLQGEGNLVRHIRLNAVADLDHPDLQELMTRAMATAKVPLRAGGRRQLIIKSISPKQRPRRPSASARK